LEYYFWQPSEDEEFEALILAEKDWKAGTIEKYAINGDLYSTAQVNTILSNTFSMLSRQLDVDFQLVSKDRVISPDGFQKIYLSVAVVDRGDGSPNHGWQGLDESKNGFMIFDKDGLGGDDRVLSFISLHEIMHSFGLLHPHDGTVQLTEKYDNQKYSIMSYQGHTSFNTTTVNGVSGLYLNVTPSSLMILDYLALGKKGLLVAEYENGDNTYSWGKDEKVLHTIYDTGGKDQISAADHERDTIIDLRQGHFSSYGKSDKSDKSDGVAVENLAIAYGTVIENAIGGKGNDVLIGNDTANELTGGKGDDILTGGDSPLTTAEWQFFTKNKFYYYLSKVDNAPGSETDNDTLKGGEGDDHLYGMTGNDKLDGGDDNDLLVGGAGKDELIGGKGNDILQGGNDIDTYVFDGEFGADVLVDSDGKGAIKIGGITLGQFQVKDGTDIIYHDDKKNPKFEIIKINEGDSTSLLITALSGSGTNGSVRIKNWSAGNLGLSLSDVKTPAEPASNIATVGGTGTDNMLSIHNLLDTNPSLNLSQFTGVNIDGEVVFKEKFFDDHKRVIKILTFQKVA